MWRRARLAEGGRKQEGRNDKGEKGGGRAVVQPNEGLGVYYGSRGACQGPAGKGVKKSWK